VDAKSFALRLLLTIPALGSLPGSRLSPSPARPLYAVGAPSVIPIGYGLSVVSVPAPPADLATSSAGSNAACPVDIRAIVTGDTPADTFVIVAIGDESALLKKGQGLKSREGWVAISDVAPDRVVLRKGDQAFDCFLGAAAGNQPPGPGELVR
jgi:hypothetical protein